MAVPVRGLGYFVGGSASDDFDFATAYANELSATRAEYRAAGRIPTEKEVRHE
jgi:hypothetical protein